MSAKLLVLGEQDPALRALRALGAVTWSVGEVLDLLTSAVADGSSDLQALLAALFEDGATQRAALSGALDLVGQPAALRTELEVLLRSFDGLCIERELSRRIARCGRAELTVVADVRQRDTLDYFVSEGFSTLSVGAFDGALAGLATDFAVPADAHPARVAVVVEKLTGVRPKAVGASSRQLPLL